MSIAISVRTVGKHSPANPELRARRAESDNVRLTATIEDQARDLHTALVRGCQDSMLIARLKEERAGLVAYNRELRDKTIRAKAEQERLRRAVVNARPRITVAEQQLDRPYVSAVQLPYPVPVGRDTSNDETQQLPVIDQPEPWPTYRMQHP